MLADELDYVTGVDPHRDTHALAVVDVRSGGVARVTKACFVLPIRTLPAGVPSRLRALARSGRVSLDSSSAMRSGCSRSAGCDGSGSPARTTRSMRSEPLAACSAKRGQPGHARAASEKGYEH